MRDIILLLAEVVNKIHDILIAIFSRLGLELSDKDLHFWIIGFLGLMTFFVVYFCFKLLEKAPWNITIFSFIYTFTVMVVVVFAIEIQQAITNRGNMEFADAAIGLWGFLVFFLIYAGVALAAYTLFSIIKKRKKANEDSDNEERKCRSRTYDSSKKE